MGDKFIVTKNESGQAVVEFLLMFVVVAMMAFAVYESELVQGFVGEDMSILKKIERNVIFSYRHAYEGKEIELIPDYNSADHKSYSFAGETRFFGPADPYPVE